MKGIPVLMYHHVSPEPGPYTVSPDTFRAQLQWLSDAGFQCLTAYQFQRYSETGERPAERCVLLTFDDGWLDNWMYAVPILRSFGSRALLFVITSWPGSGETRQLERTLIRPRNHFDAMKESETPETRDNVVMRWSELRSAVDQGVLDLESHSHTHGRWWSELSMPLALAALENDMQKTRDAFLENLGRLPSHFCWPRGLFSRSMKRKAESMGFGVQYSTLRGTNLGRPDSGQSKPLVRRINMVEQPLEIFKSQVNLYSRPLVGQTMGKVHQCLQSWRMASKYRGVFPAREFYMPPWYTV